MQTQARVANMKRDGLFCEHKNPFTTRLHFPNSGSPAVVTQRAGQTSFCQYHIGKSVPSLSETLGVRALSELWGGDILDQRKKPRKCTNRRCKRT